MSYRIIVADNQEMFRVGTARLLGIEDDFRVVGQCVDAPRLLSAAELFPGSTLLCAASITHDWPALKAALSAFDCLIAVMLENTDDAIGFVELDFPGVLYRSVSAPELAACVRAVASGQRHIQSTPASHPGNAKPDALGEKARNRLTRKELEIVTLLVQGYKNKDIADELGNTEQVIKNYMRTIFDKTGVTDRLELVLFTIHHKVLLDPASPLRPSSPETDQFLQRTSLTSKHTVAARTLAMRSPQTR